MATGEVVPGGLTRRGPGHRRRSAGLPPGPVPWPGRCENTRSPCTDTAGARPGAALGAAAGVRLQLDKAVRVDAILLPCITLLIISIINGSSKAKKKLTNNEKQEQGRTRSFNCVHLCQILCFLFKQKMR